MLIEPRHIYFCSWNFSAWVESPEFELDAIDCLTAVYSLLITKCKLEVEVVGVENALQTCRAMLLIWKNLYEATNDR